MTLPSPAASRRTSSWSGTSSGRVSGSRGTPACCLFAANDDLAELIERRNDEISAFGYGWPRDVTSERRKCVRRALYRPIGASVTDCQNRSRQVETGDDLTLASRSGQRGRAVVSNPSA